MDRPNTTLNQKIGALIAGVPIIATLLHAFGVYDMSDEQVSALKEALQWAGIVAVGLFGADFGLRAARNRADATRDAAAMTPAPIPAQPAVPDVGIGDESDDILPTDADELVNPPPEDEIDSAEDIGLGVGEVPER